MRFFKMAFAGLGVAAFVFLAAPRAARAAFGISPPFLNASHLVAGATYSQTIYLVQDQPNADLTIKASLNTPDAIKSWITIDKGLTFVIPQGTRQFPIAVTVQIPKNVNLGKYSGNILFETVPSQGGGQVTIALGANLSVNLTIGNDVFEQFSIPLITFPDIEEGWNPRAYVKFRNEGNIPEAFDSGLFEVFDQYGSVRLDYIQKQGDFPETPPFTTKEYTIEFPTNFHLGIGDYWGSVQFVKDGKVVANQKTIFHVLPEGSLSPWSKTLRLLKTYWIYAVAGLVALVFIVRWAMRRASRKKG